MPLIFKTGNSKTEAKNGTLFLVRDQAFRDSNINYERLMILGGIVVHIDESNKSVSLALFAIERKYCVGAWPNFDKMQVSLEVTTASPSQEKIRLDRDLLEELITCQPAYAGEELIYFKGAIIHTPMTRTSIERFSAYAVPFVDRMLDMQKWPANAVLAWLRYRLGRSIDDFGGIKGILADKGSRMSLLKESILNHVMREKSKILKGKISKGMPETMFIPRGSAGNNLPEIRPFDVSSANPQVREWPEMEPFVIQSLCYGMKDPIASFQLGLMYLQRGMGRNLPMSFIDLSYDGMTLLEFGRYTQSLIERLDYGYPNKVFQVKLLVSQETFISAGIRAPMVVLEKGKPTWIIANLRHIDNDDYIWLFETYGTTYIQFITDDGRMSVSLVFPFEYEVIKFFYDRSANEVRKSYSNLAAYILKLREIHGMRSFPDFLTTDCCQLLLRQYNEVRTSNVATELYSYPPNYGHSSVGPIETEFKYEMPRPSDTSSVINYINATNDIANNIVRPTIEFTRQINFAEAIRQVEQRQTQAGVPAPEELFGELLDEKEDPEYCEDGEER
jgi:hypothetical protein